MTDEIRPSFGSSPIAILLMLAAIVAYGWQVHGFWIGAGLGVLFLLILPLSNMVAISAFQSLKLTTTFRWLIFATIMIGIAVFGGETCDASGNCEPLI
ncbi:hypothetical protein [Erythrobacter sp.]|uniref:hypothetical protein n=1 Tax=Erythrobacter sp. TaxID=1042 RepID=UPI001425C953|nr:hypothetical protein [Erythrobacter sp.]QIQ85329.1 MAG: hypothetical protein G9473_00515 [Erythrobacter sp.]